MLPPAAIRAALQSEYNTSYNTKAENKSLNNAVVKCAAALENRTRTPEQRKTSVLAKVMNAIIRTIPYPLTMLANYVLGYGDSWCPNRYAKHDFWQFQARLLQDSAKFINLEVQHTFVAPAAEDGHDGPAVVDAAEPTVRAMDDATWYEFRSSLLADWSPVELTVAFEHSQPTTVKAKMFVLTDGEREEFRNMAHNPRYGKDKLPAPAIPQPMKEHPLRPSDQAPTELREEYAAWALGNFYPYDKMMSAVVDEQPNPLFLTGDTIWAKLKYWETVVPKPRGEKDEFALYCIENTQISKRARAMMRDDSKRSRILMRAVQNTQGDLDDEINRTADDDDDVDDYGVSLEVRMLGITRDAHLDLMPALLAGPGR